MEVKDFFTKKTNKLNGDITMYVCGPTLYDEPHIGNMRPVIIFDILNRVLSLKSKVKYVHNLTDIDDKIIKKAQDENVSEKVIFERYEKKYISLLEKLNIIMPTHLPKVTENIEGMVKFIDELVSMNFAYVANGSVYFSIKSIENYGKKGNLILDHLKDSEKNLDKKDKKDFVIWKKTNEGINYNSPWGKGRPGWHTECSYLIKDIFGSNGITIHGGGIDLKFPHHINEMAQYEAYTNNTMAENWIYVGHVNIDSKKMSKSVGNIINANEFINKYDSNVLRMMLISVDYTKPLDLNENVIENARKSFLKIKNSIIKAMVSLSLDKNSLIKEKKPSVRFVEYLENDLDIPLSITFIYKLVKELNQEKNNKRKEELIEEIIANMKLLGFSIQVNFNELKNEIKHSQETNDYDSLDKLKKELIK